MHNNLDQKEKIRIDSTFYRTVLSNYYSNHKNNYKLQKLQRISVMMLRMLVYSVVL